MSSVTLNVTRMLLEWQTSAFLPLTSFPNIYRARVWAKDLLSAYALVVSGHAEGGLGVDIPSARCSAPKEP